MSAEAIQHIGKKLALKSITKSFPGVKVLSGVNLSFFPGKVNALLGENGAGKSTLLKILTGIYTDYEGQIFINDKPISFNQIQDARLAGIAMIHQELSLVPAMSVCENLFLGQEIKNSWGFPDKQQMRAITKTQLAALGLEVAPEKHVNTLSVGEQQLLEIARVLLSDASIILMDEPTSALSEKEVTRLHEVMQKLCKEGKTIVYISHKMDELFQIADHYTVLRDGVVTGAGLMAEVTEAELIRMMVGRDVIIQKKIKKNKEEQVFFSVRNLVMKHATIPGQLRLDKVNLDIGRGEILGIFGLMGAGRSELLHGIFGSLPCSCETFIEGKKVEIGNPRSAIKNGLAFVTEDRKEEGLVLGLSVADNVNLTTGGSKWIRDSKSESSVTRHYIESLAIKTPNQEQLCKNLSGGNQQKVVLAKWLVKNPSLLLLDEPTRGIDIKAKNEIYKLIKKLADKGISILLVSSEIPEILAISDRILVMSNGKISAEFSCQEANEDKLLKAAI